MSPQAALDLFYAYCPKTSPGVFEKEFPELVTATGEVRFEISSLLRHTGGIKLSGTRPDG